MGTLYAAIASNSLPGVMIRGSGTARGEDRLISVALSVGCWWHCGRGAGVPFQLRFRARRGRTQRHTVSIREWPLASEMLGTAGLGVSGLEKDRISIATRVFEAACWLDRGTSVLDVDAFMAAMLQFDPCCDATAVRNSLEVGPCANDRSARSWSP